MPKVLDTDKLGRDNKTMKPIKPIERLKDFKIERCKKLIFKSYTFLICNLLFFNLFASQAFAIEVAPRISDKEIIEGLAELKAGQKAIDKRFDDVNKRFDDVNRRFDDVNKRIDDLKESTQQQINGLKELIKWIQWMLGLFITVVLFILGAMGRILWIHQKKLTQIETSLKAQKEELSFLKTLIEKLQILIEKLLPPRGVL